MANLNIAILGANSHIAKGLSHNFLTKSENALHLFTRSAANTDAFLASIGPRRGDNGIVIEGYQNFRHGNYDVIINCVGAGTPDRLGHDYSVWFTLTEEYDNLVLGYLRQHPDALYINFSSGAVYGKDGSAPVEENTLNRICVNHIPVEDYYTIARLNSEAKHRAHESLNIVDIRIFAYFSRFIDLDSGYFITETVKCARDKKVLKTGAAGMVRDYIHPDDLVVLIEKCIEAGKLNSAFDAVSVAPAEKFQILDFFKAEYGLQYEIDTTQRFSSPNGARSIYCSDYNRADIIGYRPAFSAMDAIRNESRYILKD